jgi:hypothetical protein
MMGTFDVLYVPYLLWSFAALNSSSLGVDVIMCALEALSSSSISVLRDSQDRSAVHLCQIHQFLLFVELELSVPGRMSIDIDRVQEVKLFWGKQCLEAFSRKGVPSCLQHDVASIVRRLEVDFEEEVIDPRSGYSIDILVKQGGKDIAIEVDGPSHFLYGGRDESGATALKRRQLGLLGYKTVCVPYWEWDGFAGEQEKENYIKGLILG